MSKCWAIITAGGSGKRMRRREPKQYLKILGKTVIEHAMNAFLDHKIISGVVVVTPVDDTRWEKIEPSHPKYLGRVEGGAERSDSVLNGLDALLEHAKADDWVLVHDAARPCINETMINRLTKKTMRHAVGGILGVPVTDSIKKTGSYGNIVQTVSRENIWCAQTPQMFRLQVLRGALSDLKMRGVQVTDDAAAMEFMGVRSLIVEGTAANIKITTPADLPLAEYYLKANAKAQKRAEKRKLFKSRKKEAQAGKDREDASEEELPEEGRKLIKRPKFLGG